MGRSFFKRILSGPTLGVTYTRIERRAVRHLFCIQHPHAGAGDDGSRGRSQDHYVAVSAGKITVRASLTHPRLGPGAGCERASAHLGWAGPRGRARGARPALTSLAGRAVLAVLGPVAFDDLPGAVVAPDGEGQAKHMVAGLDDPQDAAHPVPLLLLALPGLEVLHQLVLHDAGAAVEEALHHLEEVGVVLAVGRRLAVVSPGGRREPRLRGGGGGTRLPAGPAQQRGRVGRRGAQGSGPCAGQQQRFAQAAVHGGGAEAAEQKRSQRPGDGGREEGPGADCPFKLQLPAPWAVPSPPAPAA